MWQDLRYALRGIRRSPGFALVAAVTLALGIGANSAIFSFLNELLLCPVPQTADPSSLVQLRRRKPLEHDTSGFTRRSYDRYADLSRSFSGLLAYRDVDVHLGWGGRPESLSGQVVSGNFFSVLGLRMRAGRPLGPADNRIEGGHPVAVISASLWERRFGGEAAALGRRITINRSPFAIVAVAPAGFRGIEVGSQTDVWIPLSMERLLRARFDSEGFDMLSLVGRLKRGATLFQAQAEIDVLARRHARSGTVGWREQRNDHRNAPRFPHGPQLCDARTLGGLGDPLRNRRSGDPIHILPARTSETNRNTASEQSFLTG